MTKTYNMNSDIFLDVEVSEAPAKDAIFDYLTDHLGLSSKNEVKVSDLTSYLNELLFETSINGDSNHELIGALNNIIAAYSS